MIEWLHTSGIKVGIIILLGLIFYAIAKRMVPRVVRRTMTLRMKDKPESTVMNRSKTISRVIANTLGVIIGIIVLFTILGQVGLNIGPALASLGIAGLAISFGAQTMIKNLINGLFILLDAQYGIGDVVKVGGVSGVVEEVSLRQTVLRDIDGVVHYVPNSEISIASNYTKDYSRVNMNILVAYGEDLDRVIRVINRVCKKMADEEPWREKILKAPQVFRVEVLAESGVEIKILGDTRPGVQWDMMSELRKRIKTDFAQEGIQMPLPQMKVYFGNRRDKDQVS